MAGKELACNSSNSLLLKILFYKETLLIFALYSMWYDLSTYYFHQAPAEFLAVLRRTGWSHHVVLPILFHTTLTVGGQDDVEENCYVQEMT